MAQAKHLGFEKHESKQGAEHVACDPGPLINAAEQGDLEVLEQRLAAGDDVNMADRHGFTALVKASARYVARVATHPAAAQPACSAVHTSGRTLHAVSCMLACVACRSSICGTCCVQHVLQQGSGWRC